MRSRSLEGWHSLVSEEISDTNLAADVLEYMGTIPTKYDRLYDLPYLEEALSKLVTKAKEVYLPSKGDPYIFRYFMMLCIQSITAFSGKDSVPNYEYAFLFCKLDDYLCHQEDYVDHNKVVIDDLSTALIHARSDAKLLRQDLNGSRKDLELVREDLSLAREEIKALRCLNHALMWGTADGDPSM
jgi:hypothetical protein